MSWVQILAAVIGAVICMVLGASFGYLLGWGVGAVLEAIGL